jgi:hypothetical protein
MSRAKTEAFCACLNVTKAARKHKWKLSTSLYKRLNVFLKRRAMPPRQKSKSRLGSGAPKGWEQELNVASFCEEVRLIYFSSVLL